MSSESKPLINVHVHFCNQEHAQAFRDKLQNDPGLRDFLKKILASAKKLEGK